MPYTVPSDALAELGNDTSQAIAVATSVTVVVTLVVVVVPVEIVFVAVMDLLRCE